MGTDTSFFSAKSDVTLVEEPSSLLDFDDAFNQGIADMLTPGATPATPAHGLKEENPSTPTQASVEMENDVATPIPNPEAQMEVDVTKNGAENADENQTGVQIDFETADDPEDGAAGGDIAR